MGVAQSSLPIRPWYPPEKELSQQERNALLMLRLVSLGWAGTSYLRALFVSPLRYSGRPLFLETLQEPAQRTVRSYTFFAWYISLRFYLASDGRNSFLKQISRRLARHRPLWQIFLGAIVAHSTLDEAVYTLSILLNDGKAELEGQPLPPPLSDRVCCICHDGERGSTLVNFCLECPEHAAHYGCMQAWYTSTAALSHHCPLCRGSLRTLPTPLKDRCMTLMRSHNFWKGLLRRLGLATGCASLATLMFWVGLVLQTLQGRLRPGYVHGQTLSAIASD
eukprot:m.32311 g.32311  ORF g.32311 m.32311 type:complete len:278 (+) comp12145_c0_seq2:119-952(+)